MKRRTAIKITAIGALAPKLDTLSPALGHLPTGAGGLARDDKLRFFTAEERELLDQLMEMIIPTDDHAPGAKAAEVSLFADLMVSTSGREVQKQWREGLMQMQEEARKSSLTEALAKSAAHEDHPTTDLERFFQARVYLDTAKGGSAQPLDATVERIDPEASFTPENTYFREERVKQVVGVKLRLTYTQGAAKPGMPADGEILVAGTNWPLDTGRR